MPEVRTTSSTGGQKGVKLARFDLIPAGPLKALAEHYGRGARKYANHQWRQGYEWSKSIAALGRHFNDFMAGKDYDVCSNDPDGCSFVDAEGQPYEPVEPDTCFNHTGSHHMAAVAWHSFLLLEFGETYPEHDDRYKALVNLAKADWCADRYVVPYRFVVGIVPGDITDYGPDLLSKHKPAWVCTCAPGVTCVQHGNDSDRAAHAVEGRLMFNPDELRDGLDTVVDDE